MNKKTIKYVLVPGALGLTLACQSQVVYASDMQPPAGIEASLLSSHSSEVSVDGGSLSSPQADQSKAQTNEPIAQINDNVMVKTGGTGQKNEEQTEVKADMGLDNKASQTTVPIAQPNESAAQINDNAAARDSDTEQKEKAQKETKTDKKADQHPDYNTLKYEDENYNKNFQNHSIEDENNGNFKFEKGKPLTEKEIEEEFNRYKENSSSFAKVQEWLPKLKEMNLLGLDKDEKSQFYKIKLQNADGTNETLYSFNGLKVYKGDFGRSLVYNLDTDKVYKLESGETITEILNIVGSTSDDLKNYANDQDNPLYKQEIFGGNAESSIKTVNRDGAYAKKITNPDGSVSYEFYEGGNEKQKNADLEKVKKAMQEVPSALYKELGKEYSKEILHRAYMAALVNSYLVKNEKDMSLEDRKNIVDYVYRFGINYKNDESLISKTNTNGYVDVSPLGYAEANGDGTYKYKYQVSFNSITSNDIYSSTHLDIYAPIMAKNFKFTLNGIQEYTKKDDGTYAYEHRDVNVELGIANTKDEETRKLIDQFLDNPDENTWNNEEHKHKENTFSIPYYNDLKDRKKLDHKVVELEDYVDFEVLDREEYNSEGVLEKMVSEYRSDHNGSDEDRAFKEGVQYKQFRLVNPQSGGPVTFTVEFDIDKDQVEKSPNMPLAARMLNKLSVSDPTAFAYKKFGSFGSDNRSSFKPGAGVHDSDIEADKSDTSWYPEDYKKELERNNTINQILRGIKAEKYATIFNHPEFIKAGNFDINGYYGNAGGAPSEYTGDKTKIGLKVGKNFYDFGEYVENQILKGQRLKGQALKFGKQLHINMKTSGASSFDIGVQIANGYGRYGDYRANTKIKEDKFIEKLMSLQDISIPKSKQRVNDVFGNIPDRDVTEDYRGSDGNPDREKLWKFEHSDESGPGNGAKDLLSDNIRFGPSNNGLISTGNSNVDSAHGGVDVTPIGPIKQNKDGTWRYEYQVSLRGVCSSAYDLFAGDYNIVMPSFVKNVKFTLVGNSDDVNNTYNVFRELKNYDRVLGDEEKVIINQVKEGLRKAGFSDKLSSEEVADKILRKIQFAKSYNKNQGLGIEEWNPNTKKFIASEKEVKSKYEDVLAQLDVIPDGAFGKIGKTKTAYKEALKTKYESALKSIKEQQESGKRFLTDSPGFISENERQHLEDKYVLSEPIDLQYEEYSTILLEGYQRYIQEEKDKEIQELDAKYNNQESPEYEQAHDEIILKYAKLEKQIQLSFDSWTGTGKIRTENDMLDYKDLVGKDIKLISKRGYLYSNPGILKNVDLSKVNVYTVDTKGNPGVVSLRVTFDVDEEQVRKTPFLPLDVRNAWKFGWVEGYVEQDSGESLLEYNGLADRIVHKKTGQEISPSLYEGLSANEKDEYYTTNYYFVEHPEKIRRGMFDIHGLHTEPSVDVTSYTGQWQSIGEDIGPWGDNLRRASFEFNARYKLWINRQTTYLVGLNEDYRDIAVAGQVLVEPPIPPEIPPTPEIPPETPPTPEIPPETPPTPEIPPETPPTPEIPPETPPAPEIPPETPPTPEIPPETPKISEGKNNPQTGVDGISGMISLLLSSLAGLLMIRRKKNKKRI